MKQLTYIIISTFAVIIPICTSAQETTSLIDHLELQQLQEVACTGNTDNPELQSAIVQLESMLSQALTDGGVDLTDPELQFAYNQAIALQDQLKMHPEVKQLCESYTVN